MVTEPCALLSSDPTPSWKEETGVGLELGVMIGQYWKIVSASFCSLLLSSAAWCVPQAGWGDSSAPLADCSLERPATLRARSDHVRFHFDFFLQFY